jgi:DNA repair protein RecN (Recombination protein N)
MLQELRIENFAIINQLELQFGPGLITFTGETGAGKSIILDALESVLGGRTDATAIRSGAERASVEATFRLPDHSKAAICAILERDDLLDDPDYVTLARDIRREGRSVARVNGRSVGVGLLKEIGAFLVDIHGQSEHLSLLNTRQHIGLLDRYADDAALLEDYGGVYRRLQQTRRSLNELRAAERDAERRMDLLNYQAQEIESAGLKPGEEEELRADRARLSNAESLANLAQQAVTLLDEGTLEAPAITDLLGQAVQAMQGLGRIDAELTEQADQAETALETLTELSRDLRVYLENIEYNPRRLEQIEERLDLIQGLKRKYGGTLEAAIAFAADARAQLETIQNAGARIAELEEAESALLAELAIKGLALSEKRKAAAQALAGEIEAELNDLRMAGAQFAVDLQLRPDPNGAPLPDGRNVAFDASGLDQVEFLVAPNPGEGLKPLVKIASGGETSRLMLALKNVLARADTIPTLIFDEIDQGIGGRVGMVVGEKLWELSTRHQVFCITHLPQLAAYGSQHYRVTKLVEDGRTSTQVERLEQQARVEELASMLGGISAGTLRSAEEILSTVKAQTG